MFHSLKPQLIWIMILFLSLPTSLASAQSSDAMLELELQCFGQDLNKLQLTLRNTGNTDTAIVMGKIYGIYMPDALSFDVRLTGDSTVYNFLYFDPEHDFIAGRVDPWIIPLPVKSSYTIVLEGDVFWSEVLRARLTDTAGISDIKLHLEAGKMQYINADTTGLAHMNVRIANIESAQVVFPASCK